MASAARWFRSHPCVFWPLLAAVASAAVGGALTSYLRRGEGLVQTSFLGSGTERRLRGQRTTRTIDLSILAGDPGLARGGFVLRWEGAFGVPRTAVYDLSLTGDGRLVLQIDRRVAHQHSTESPAANPRTVWLAAGVHAIELEYEQQGASPALQVLWGPAGTPLRPIDTARLLPTAPASPRLDAALVNTRDAAGYFAWTGGAVAAWFLFLELFRWAARQLLRRFGTRRVATARRVAAVTLPALVVAYAALLRMEAITATYGPVASPGWLHAAQRQVGALGPLRPAALTWAPAPLYPHKDGPPSRYTSDPYTYVEFARQMTSFYAAHMREPVFPFVTKIFLRVLDDQDVAVSFASATFSVLAVLATYLLGSAAFSRRVGLGAALALAIEHDVISQSVCGDRDEAFMFVVILVAWSLVRWWRAPSARNAILAGAAGGVACLVRITALSFLAPGLVCVLLMVRRPWKIRLGQVGLATLAATAVAAPYVVNCWITFGDPFYAINVHAKNYRAAEGHALDPRETAAAYVGGKALSRPIQTVDTVVSGLTAYPFSNKWSGFDPWWPPLGPWLARAALLGLVLFAGCRQGRLLLVLLATSLLPYALTWRVAADWRFTEYAYPFFLVASFAAIIQVCEWLAAPRTCRRLVRGPRDRKRLVVLAVIAAGAGAAWWGEARTLPVLAFRESLAAGEDVTVMAGGRDAAYFAEGWSEPVTSASVTSRVSIGPSSVVRLPLPVGGDCGLTLRADPFPRPTGENPRLGGVQVFVNGTFLSRVQLRWNPERVGAYDVRVPKSVIRTGLNRLTLVPDLSGAEPGDGWPPATGISEGSTFALWYVRVRLRPPL